MVITFWFICWYSITTQFKAAFQGVILNPGTLYTSTRTHSSPEKSVEWFDGYNQDAMFSGKTDDGQQYRGYFQLFHANAKSLSGEKKVDCITQRWGVDKRCLLDLKVVQLIPSVQRD